MPDASSRISQLLAQMTVREKVGQLNLLHGAVDADRGAIRDGKVSGFLLGPPRWADGEKFSWAGEVNALQRIAVEESRLGIPLIMSRDVIHGHRTVFPIPLGQAASFDPALARRCAQVAAREASAQGVRWNYSPMIDIARDPRWGRVAEGYGEDPYLCSRMGEQVIRGYQGDSLSNPETMAACAKHFVGYGAGEAGRDYASAELSERTLREVYLPPFFAAVRAGVASVMTAIHDLNGIPMAIHEELQKRVLREQFGFEGLIVTDWGTIADLLVHRICASEEEAVVRALQAGAEMDMVSGFCLKHLERLINQGVVAESVLDAAVTRVLKLKEKLGLFESPYTDPQREKTQLLTPESRRLAREAAQKAIVLLENRKGVLPLTRTMKTVAVVGPLAEAKAELLGTWTLDGRAEDVVSVMQAVKAALPPETRVIGDAVAMDAALGHAQEADVIIAVVGEHPTRSGEASSITDIGLPPGQEDFLAALSEYGLPLVAVVIAGRPLQMKGLRRYADAVLFCFHPGVEGGNAIADVVFGKVSPSGKLPCSFPRSVGQLPLHYMQRNTGRAPQLNFRYSSKYIDVPHTPLYPFGYGLSYSAFKISGFTLNGESMSAGAPLRISVTVANDGPMEAAEVAQLFVRDEVRSVAPPNWELKGFIRVSLRPGESEEISFVVAPKDLAFLGPGGEWIAEAGKFLCRVVVGSEERCVTVELSETVRFSNFYGE